MATRATKATKSGTVVIDESDSHDITTVRDALKGAPAALTEHSQWPMYVCDTARGFEHINSGLCGGTVVEKFSRAFPSLKYAHSSYSNYSRAWKLAPLRTKIAFIKCGRTTKGTWGNFMRDLSVVTAITKAKAARGSKQKHRDSVQGTEDSSEDYDGHSSQEDGVQLLRVSPIITKQESMVKLEQMQMSLGFGGASSGAVIDLTSDSD
jgi:hypothetical protein